MKPDGNPALSFGGNPVYQLPVIALMTRTIARSTSALHSIEKYREYNNPDY
jgi:hypothetical protein